MLEKIRQFMRHDDFHNPVTDKARALLSRKERAKGKFTPLAAAAGLFALNAGMFLMANGLLATLGTLLLASCLAPALLDIRHRLLFKNSVKTSVIYDMAQEKDRAAFSRQYPRCPHLAENYLALSKEMGFSKPPRLFVTDEHGASARVSAFLGGEGFVTLGARPIYLQEPRTVLAILGHELAHVRNNDLKKRVLLSALGICTMLFASAVGGVAGTLSLACYAAATFAACRMIDAKYIQYGERAADRASACATGDAPAFAAFFPKLDESGAPQGLARLRYSFRRAVQCLTQQHPDPWLRKGYLEKFEEENRDFTQVRRAQYK